MIKITPKKVKDELKKVLDPELGISIVDLGLVYDIKLNKDSIKLIMTLTTIDCPLYSMIEDDIRTKIKELGFINNQIDIQLTFDPPWTMDKISKKAKALIGI
jgi:metal-sulfur cluster biosynthetic enzyme